MDCQEYRIKTVEDFRKVPPEKRKACMSDFIIWLDMADQKKDIDEALRELLGFYEQQEMLITSSFVWVDDGIAGVSSIEFVSGEVGK